MAVSKPCSATLASKGDDASLWCACLREQEYALVQNACFEPVAHEAGELPDGVEFLERSPRAARGLVPFPPASDDCDQSHARGRCCHPCTEGIGVDVSHETCYHLTYMDTQLRNRGFTPLSGRGEPP